MIFICLPSCYLSQFHLLLLFSCVPTLLPHAHSYFALRGFQLTLLPSWVSFRVFACAALTGPICLMSKPPATCSFPSGPIPAAQRRILHFISFCVPSLIAKCPDSATLIRPLPPPAVACLTKPLQKYRLAANTTVHFRVSSPYSHSLAPLARRTIMVLLYSLSRLIFICASSIFFIRLASPMTLAASRTSRQVSSSRVITRTIVPSATSVNVVICSKG